MDKFFAKLKKKKGNLLSDPSVSPPRTPASVTTSPAAPMPSFSSLLATPSPIEHSGGYSGGAPIPSLHTPPVRRQSTRPTYEVDAPAYSAVGGDGAIGGLDWEPEPPPSHSPSHVAVDVHVPTMGQIAQLTEAQEASIRSMQQQHAAAISTNDTATAPATPSDDAAWEQATFTRSRSLANASADAKSNLTPPPALPPPVHRSPALPLLAFTSISANSAAAMVPGARGSGSANAAAAGQSSNPSSRRGSMSGSMEMPMNEGLNRSRSFTLTPTPVVVASASPLAVNLNLLPAYPALLASASSSSLHAAHSQSPAQMPSSGFGEGLAAHAAQWSVSGGPGLSASSSAAATTGARPASGRTFPALPAQATRSMHSGPASAHMFSIGRAAGAKVASVMNSGQLTAPSSTLR